MRSINRTVVIVRPKQPFVDWVRRVDPGEPPPPEAIGTEPTAYLIPDFDYLEDAHEYVSLHYDLIFEEELFGWFTDEDLWPEGRSLERFFEWFEVAFHTMVMDIASGEIVHEEF